MMRRFLVRGINSSSIGLSKMIVLISLAILLSSTTTHSKVVVSSSSSSPGASTTTGGGDKDSLSLRPIDITSKEYTSNVGDGNVWLIEFFTPWYVKQNKERGTATACERSSKTFLSLIAVLLSSSL